MAYSGHSTQSSSPDRSLSQTNARTPAGLAVKFRRLRENLDTERGECDLNGNRRLLESPESLDPSFDHSGDLRHA